MRRHRVLFLLALAIAAGAAASAPAVLQAPVQCSASFHVLHDDSVGTLELPEGAYQITATDLSCLRASHLFAEFLQDYDGKLPRPWRYTAQAAGQGTFARGSSAAQFAVLRTDDATPGTPGHSSQGGGTHGDLACPGTFEVEHNDRVGALRLRRGDYLITLLGSRLSCSRASNLLARFLQRPSGRLFGDWVVLPDLGEFVNGSSYYGFRVKRVS
jgi:hypothetical protein